MATNNEPSPITEDAMILAEFCGVRPSEIMELGYGYCLTELTPKEAEQLGAKAYLKMRTKKE